MAPLVPSMSTDDLFRFIAIRDPDRAIVRLPRVVTWIPSYTYAGGTGTSVPTGPPAIRSIDGAPALIRAIDQYLNARAGMPLVVSDLIAHIQRTWWRLQNPKEAAEPPLSRLPRIVQIVRDPVLSAACLECAQSLLAATFGIDAADTTRPDLMRVMQLIGLLGFLAEAPGSPAPVVQRVIEDTQVLVPGDPIPRPPVSLSPQSTLTLPAAASTADPGATRAALLVRIERLNAAADDLGTLLMRPGDVGIAYDGSAPWVLHKLRTIHLAPSTNALLQEVGIGEGRSIFDLVDQLRALASDAFTQAILPSSGEEAARRQIALVNELARARGQMPAVPADENFVTQSGAVLARPPRVGDLQIVRQQFVRYEKGEVAHVENVLAREHRERLHKIVDLTETETTDVTETEEERSWDNQTTTRDELAKETSNVVSENTQFQAGVQVAARYGPYVEVNANVGFAKSSSTNDTEHNARKYAKDVTERAAGRVRTRVMATRRSLTRREVTEQNVHGFDNRGGQQHIVGFYRWLNKRYSAQMYNLGRRLMLELVIPDPAMYFRYAAATGAGMDIDVEPAPKLVYPNSNDRLRPEHVTPWTWKGLATQFRAQGVSPPPAEYITITNALSATTQEPKPYAKAGSVEVNVNAYFKDDQKLQIPAGYQPLLWAAVVLSGDRLSVGSSAVVLTGPYTNGYIALGPSMQSVGGPAAPIFGTFDAGASPPYGLPAVAPAGEKGAMLPVSLFLIGPPGFTATITVLCRRSAAALDKWQMSTWDAIVASHGAWEREYREAVHGAEVGRGVTISGQNPIENQMIIRDELKRSAIQMLGGPAPADLIATKRGDPATNTPPELQVDSAGAVGPEMLFWEQSFEWENLTYSLYPYFWTGRADWPQQSRLNDPDPLFAEFLRAGASRVIIPVRPGFELPVALRLAIKLPKKWLSSPAPVVAKEPWLSIAEEVRARQDDTTGTAVGTPWPVVLPTTLIMLDDGKDLFGEPDGAGPSRRPNEIPGRP